MEPVGALSLAPCRAAAVSERWSGAYGLQAPPSAQDRSRGPAPNNVSGLQVSSLASAIVVFEETAALLPSLRSREGRFGCDSLSGTSHGWRRGTLPTKSQEPSLLGKAPLPLRLRLMTARFFLSRIAVGRAASNSSEGEQKSETLHIAAVVRSSLPCNMKRLASGRCYVGTRYSGCTSVSS